jgi:heme-degrading monooxygenase HmoA
MGSTRRFDSLDAVQAWRSSDPYKEARRIGDTCAKFRSFGVEGLPQ